MPSPTSTVRRSAPTGQDGSTRSWCTDGACRWRAAPWSWSCAATASPGCRAGTDTARSPNLPTATDLVDRRFRRDAPDQLWVTDITEHPTRGQGLLRGRARRVQPPRGRLVHRLAPQASLATSALAMAINNREPNGSTIHSDHGTQFTSWAFTQRARYAALAVSMGSIGDCFDNAVIEAFGARMQVELLNRRRWRTRLELSNAIFEYLEVFHNRQRRHSSLGMLTPVKYEIRHATTA